MKVYCSLEHFLDHLQVTLLFQTNYTTHAIFIEDDVNCEIKNLHNTIFTDDNVNYGIEHLYFHSSVHLHCFTPFTGYDELNKLACSQCMGLHSSIG